MNPTELQTAAAALLAALTQSKANLTPAQIDALRAALATVTPDLPPTSAETITRDKIEVQPGGNYQPNWQVEKVEINPLPPSPAEKRAADAESEYLRRLRVQSNALPLAQDSRAAGDRDKDAKTPELANVYVDLQVSAGPELEQILHRMSVPAAKRKEQRTQLAAWLKKVPGERNPTPKEGGATKRYWTPSATGQPTPTGKSTRTPRSLPMASTLAICAPRWDSNPHWKRWPPTAAWCCWATPAVAKAPLSTTWPISAPGHAWAKKAAGNPHRTISSPRPSCPCA